MTSADRSSEPEASGPARPAKRKIVSTVLWWIDPEENPSGLIYGTIAVGAVLAVEGPRRQTFVDTVSATVIILGLYWLAHAYASVTGQRLRTRRSLSAGTFWAALRHEGAIVKGAVVPIAVLLVLWAAGVSLDTAVTAGLWTSAALLVLFEMAAALRSHLSPAETAIQVLVGSLFGAGVLLLRLLLH
jgi:hypothetical protein